MWTDERIRVWQSARDIVNYHHAWQMSTEVDSLLVPTLRAPTSRFLSAHIPSMYTSSYMCPFSSPISSAHTFFYELLPLAPHSSGSVEPHQSSEKPRRPPAIDHGGRQRTYQRFHILRCEHKRPCECDRRVPTVCGCRETVILVVLASCAVRRRRDSSARGGNGGG